MRPDIAKNRSNYTESPFVYFSPTLTIDLFYPFLDFSRISEELGPVDQKIYHVDPLLCPKCRGTMKIISFIEEPDVIFKSPDALGEIKDLIRRFLEL